MSNKLRKKPIVYLSHTFDRSWLQMVSIWKVCKALEIGLQEKVGSRSEAHQAMASARLGPQSLACNSKNPVE